MKYFEILQVKNPVQFVESGKTILKDRAVLPELLQKDNLGQK